MNLNGTLLALGSIGVLAAAGVAKAAGSRSRVFAPRYSNFLVSGADWLKDNGYAVRFAVDEEGHAMVLGSKGNEDMAKTMAASARAAKVARGYTVEVEGPGRLSVYDTAPSMWARQFVTAEAAQGMLEGSR